MDEIKKIFESGWYLKVVNSIIVILVSILIYRITVKVINKSENKIRAKLFTSNKSKTYANLIKSVAKYIFIIILSTKTILVKIIATLINLGSS